MHGAGGDKDTEGGRHEACPVDSACNGPYDRPARDLRGRASATGGRPRKAYAPAAVGRGSPGLGVLAVTTNATGIEFGLLHLIGRDRVGILQEAAEFVVKRGAAIREGIAHTLSTEAVVLLYVMGTPRQLELVEKDAPKLGESLQLLALFTRIRELEPRNLAESLPLTLRVSSPDFDGLLTAMTSFFTRHGLSIVAHHAHKAELPRPAGLVTYRHRFTVMIPHEFNRKNFLAELDQLAEQVNFIRDDISHSDFY